MPPTLDQLRRATLVTPPDPAPRPGARQAAVAALLTPTRDLVFMRRAERAGDPWSGQISFPGGHREPEDADLVHTALRETQEELGLSPARGQLLGALPAVPTRGPLPAMTIHPFVFLLDEEPHFAPNEEVAAVHRVPLTALLAGEGRTTFPFDYRGATVTLPCVHFAGQRLWGLTLGIVDELLHRLDGRGVGLARSPTSPPGASR